MIKEIEKFEWDLFLQPYELAVEGFILKFEGIKKQYQLRKEYCPIELVSGRVKSKDSILDKARRMDVPFELIDEMLYDIGGVRITCKYIDDVYVVCELLKARKDIKILEIRDYIKNMKESGYRSLHILALYNVETIDGQVPVKLEFQVRTHAMHFWASIEHSLKYKYSKQIPQALRARLHQAAIAGASLDNEMTLLHHMIMEYDANTDGALDKDPLEEEVTMNSMKRW